MDLSAVQAKPTRRRYITLLMIFITVVICYVDRANLAVASAHIQQEFGISKAEMGYVFSAFAWLYTLCQIPGGWFAPLRRGDVGVNLAPCSPVKPQRGRYGGYE